MHIVFVSSAAIKKCNNRLAQEATKHCPCVAGTSTSLVATLLHLHAWGFYKMWAVLGFFNSIFKHILTRGHIPIDLQHGATSHASFTCRPPKIGSAYKKLQNNIILRPLVETLSSSPCPQSSCFDFDYYLLVTFNTIAQPETDFINCQNGV